MSALIDVHFLVAFFPAEDAGSTAKSFFRGRSAEFALTDFFLY